MITALIYNALDALHLAGGAWPAPLPKGKTVPSASYLLVSGPRDYTHGGATGVARQRWQVNAVGKTFADARDTADAVIPAMEALGSDADVSVRGCRLANERGPNFDAGANLWAVQMDFEVDYEPANATT